MGSNPRHPSDPASSLEALLASAYPGEPLSGDLLRHLRPSGVMGGLAQMPLTEILQNMDFGKRSVRVDVWMDGAEGTVQVHDGQIVHAAATTPAGTTDGEAAVLELCRRAGGFFRILYAREEVARNVHRPTTFVLLEALRVIDEATHGADAPPPTESAAGFDELGADPWSAAPSEIFSPAASAIEDPLGTLNDASAVLDIEIAAESLADPVHARVEHPRFRVGAVIHVFVGETAVSVLLEDIGRGGAFLRTDAQLASGSVVTLRLPLHGSVLEVPARIIHVLDRAAAAQLSREAGVGVRFEGLPPSVAQRLGEFVDLVAREAATRAGAAASSKPPDRLLGLVAESEFLVAAGDLESAKRVLSQAQGLAPGDDHVRRKLHSVNEAIDAAQANAFLEQAMRGGPQAVELARRATQLRPVRDVLLRSLAVFARGGAHDEVADVAEQLLELDPDDEGALRTLLDANVAMQRWSVAVSAAESLLRLRPDDEQIRTALQKIVALARRGP
jgi:tetratricopeptide (TPR) repeat protein